MVSSCAAMPMQSFSLRTSWIGSSVQYEGIFILPSSSRSKFLSTVSYQLHRSHFQGQKPCPPSALWDPGWGDKSASAESRSGRGNGIFSQLPKLPTSKGSSSFVTSFLVNYSLLMSDWWQFKHTAKDSVVRKFSTAIPVTQGVGQILTAPSKILMEKFGGRSESDKDISSTIDEELGTLGIGGETDSDDEIAAVTEDDLDPSIFWEQRKKDLEAELHLGKVTSPGFSFSAAGLLFPYHLGVCQCLIENGYIKENTPLAGSSAGAIVTAVVASGVEMRFALEATKQLAKDCRENGTAFRLGAVLRKFLVDFLPEDSHERACGRIRVAVTQIFKAPRALLVDQFDSREDLINALITSSYVPGYLAPGLTTRFRGELCVDGGITLFMPPTSSTETVRVCAFPASSFGLSDIDISPDINPEGRSTMRELFGWALEPAEDHQLELLFEQGYSDASIWVQRRQQKQQAPQEVDVQPMATSC